MRFLGHGLEHLSMSESLKTWKLENVYISFHIKEEDYLKKEGIPDCYSEYTEMK